MHDPRNNLANQVATQLITHFSDQVYLFRPVGLYPEKELSFVPGPRGAAHTPR